MANLGSIRERDACVSARLSIPPSCRWLRLLAQIVAHSGDSLLWLAVAAAALIWGAGPLPVAGWRIVAATLVSGALTAILKRAFRRQRPPNQTRGLYIGPDRYAFPSGHAGRTVCLVVLLAPLWVPWGGLLLPIWALAVGLARVGLGVHFASDIVAGWAVGLLAGLIATLLLLALATRLGPLGVL